MEAAEPVQTSEVRTTKVSWS